MFLPLSHEHACIWNPELTASWQQLLRVTKVRLSEARIHKGAVSLVASWYRPVVTHVYVYVFVMVER